MIGDILQPTHLLFVLVVALLVLGPKRLPEAGRALGKGIRDFRSAIGGEDDRTSSLSTQSAAAPPPTYAPAPPPPEPPMPTVATADQAPAEPVEAARPFV
jgi:sec-independent protein translocase protein TatA